MQKTAQGIKMSDTIWQRPTLTLGALHHCLVLCHLDYAAIVLEQITARSNDFARKAVEMGFEQHISQMKIYIFCRITEKYRIELKCATYLYQ